MQPTPSLHEQQRAHVERWRASGATRSAYCKQHGLKMSELVYWIKRGNAQIPGSAKLTLVQAKVEVVPQKSATPLILECPNGIKLHIPATASASWVGALLGALV